MATVLRIGPADHGRPMNVDEYLTGDYEEGYQYELIDGKLYVSPEANAPQGLIEKWHYKRLDRFADENPAIVNFVYNKARVFVPGRPGVTTPDPDIAAFADFPLHLPLAEIRWQEVSPIVVVEVLSLDDPDKDLVRNVELYLQVPSIKEYWVLDTRESADRPSLRVYRRQGRKWKINDLAFGDTYTTKLLPGFKLVLNPRT